jgi:hypothetical protein
MRQDLNFSTMRWFLFLASVANANNAFSASNAVANANNAFGASNQFMAAAQRFTSQLQAQMYISVQNGRRLSSTNGTKPCQWQASDKKCNLVRGGAGWYVVSDAELRSMLGAQHSCLRLSNIPINYDSS